VDAVYLRRSKPQLSWLARLFGARSAPELQVRLPFDEHGDDTLGLFGAEVLALEAGDRQSDGIRVVRGKVSSPDRSEGEVFSDFWLLEPSFLRIAQLEDFVVLDESETPVVVSCGLAPLLVSRPVRAQLGEYLASRTSLAEGLEVPALPADVEGYVLSLSIGDEVEVMGVARTIESSARRGVLEEWAPAYRAAPRPPTLVIGDEDGTRLVIGVP